MGWFLSRTALIFLFLLCPAAPVSCSLSLPVTPLAFKCSPRRQPALDPHATRALLGALAKVASYAGFAASSAGVGGDRLRGLTQCRPDLSLSACTTCLRDGTDAVSSLCMDSPAASAWFDGCYLHYYYASQEEYFLQQARPFEERSNGSYAPDQARFPPATGGLLGRLAAEAGTPSRRGFSYGEAGYGDGGRVYAAVECLRSLPPESCRTCLAGAATMARMCCSKTDGGLAVAGDCTVRFASHRFIGYVPPEAAVPGPTATLSTATATVTTYEEDGLEGDGSTGLKGKVLILAWLAGLACFAMVATGLCLLRRSILSVKVAASTLPEDMDEGENLEIASK